jgi:hypothetical protein
MMGALTNPAVFGKLITVWSFIGYIGSLPCFWKAGKLYKAKMEEKEQEA